MLLERVVDTLVAELRRRLGGRFSAEELAELYEGGTSWCLQLAMDTAPADPWAWDSGVVGGRRLRSIPARGGRLRRGPAGGG